MAPYNFKFAFVVVFLVFAGSAFCDDPKPRKWQKGPLTCLTCSDSTDCKTSTESSKCTNPEDSCVTIFDDTKDEVIERGCASKLTAECKDKDTCFKCVSSNCNNAKSKDDFVECLNCDSSEKDECVTNIDDITKTRNCHKKCMVALYPKDEKNEKAGFGLVRSCLDDKPEEDQVKCGPDGSDCKSCGGLKCNRDKLPENRLSCFQCKGSSCEGTKNPKSELCPTYKEGDTCVLIFNEGMELDEAQCKSSLTEDKVKDLEAAGHLYSCSVDGCNDPKKKPTTPECAKCDSTEDCALQPEKLTFVPCKFNYCFSQILSDGTTKRGCFKDLDPSLQEKCTEDNVEGCTQCKQNKCNNKIYPKDRRQCYKCNSATDPNCEGNPKTPVICPKYIEGNKESCVTEFNPKTKATIRGCQSEVKCEKGDPNCQTCEKQDSCNSVNLKEKNSNDPKPGKWQKGPLTCLTCSDSTDCKTSTESSKCTNPEDSCVTIFDDTKDEVIERGCASKLTAECKDKDTCFKCVSSNCNNAKSKDDFVECLNCDSSEKDECVTNIDDITKTRNCHKKCMVALYPKDEKNEKAGFGLVRSCLDDKPEEDQVKCGPDGSDCKSCGGLKCNRDKLPENRLSCFQCKGSSCEGTKNPKSELCPTYKEGDTCVLIFNEGMELDEAQCKSSLTEDKVKDLEAAGHLYSCSVDGCNDPKKKPTTPECAKCDSTEDCALQPEKLTFVPCKFNYCFSQILSDGTTKRGCFKDLDPSLQEKCTEDNVEGCTQCKQNKCNNKIYPKDRRQCYKCNSATDPNCEGNPKTPVICPKYIEGNKESCVTEFNPKTKATIRGCQSEVKCEKGDPNCQTCEKQDSCNSVNLKEKNSNDPKPGKWQKGPLTCLTCSDSTDCKTSTESSKCTNPEDSCVTIFDDTKDEVIERGCASKLTAECKDKDTCFKCVSSNCNNAKSKDDFVECLNCDSSEKDECVTNIDDITKTRNCHKKCMVALYPKDEKNEKAGFGLVRSCLDDKPEEDQVKCGPDGSDCKSCGGLKCNRDKLPENRLSCFQCKGSSCEGTKNPKSELCPTYKEGDTCVLIFNEGMELDEAQCKSSLTEDKVKDLEAAGHLYSCSVDGCNDPKKKPTTPECAKCDSTEDCALQPEKLTFVPCKFNYCFSQILSDGTTKRGCFKDLDPSLQAKCTEDNEEGCTQCKTDKCNNKIYPKGRRQCFKCNSADDPSCEGNPGTPVICPKYIPGNKESCVTKFNPETKVTKRGCKTEFPCIGSNKKKCLECKDTDSCNIINLREVNGNDPEPGKWQKLPLTCLKCNDEDKCKTSALGHSCEVETDQCVTVFNTAGIVIKRGCATDTKSDCGKEENDCFKCVSNKCNKANDKTKYKSCLSCDTHSNPKCLSDTSSITSKRDCYENCMVALYPKEKGPDPSYELVRSCLDDKEEDARTKCDSSEISCKTCSGNDCNSFLYPEKRLKCFQCQGEACKSGVKSSYCPTFKKDDVCVFTFDESMELSGAQCRSTLSNSAVEELEKAGRLFSCQEDSCNSLDKTPKMPSCLECDSTDNENCATNPEELGTTTTCNFKYCYSQVLETGATKRGCFSNLDPTVQDVCTKASTGSCTQCTEDNCNKDIYPANRKKCYRCNSTKDEKCKDKPDKAGVCPKYVGDDSCVTHFDKEKKVTTRGCSSEFPCEGKDEKQCQVCKDKDSCNTVDLEKANGAIGIYLTVGAVLATLCHLVL